VKDENGVQKPERLASHVIGSSPENEIDFSALWNMLVRREATVITVAIVTFIIIVAYVFLNAPVPIYLARVSVSLASEKDLEGIQKYLREKDTLSQSDGKDKSDSDKKKDQEYTPEKVFAAFVNTMSTRELRLRYFDENNLQKKFVADKGLNAEQVFEKRFYNMLTVNTQESRAYVDFKGLNAKLSAELVNGFVLFANKETVRDLFLSEINKRKRLIAQIGTKKNGLRMRITERRKEAKRKREDRIIQLEEAVRIAERIGKKDNALKFVLFSNPPLFMLGTKALQAEVGVLRQRKSDDPFDSRIRALQFQLGHLESQLVKMQSDIAKLKRASSDVQQISAARIIKKATAPVKPINQPVLMRIILIGVFGGLALGLLAAYFVDFIARIRDKKTVQLG
jgi:chain length determinant protein (polysaccharide antigen chain regulator)